jgi:hypothetical protein
MPITAVKTMSETTRGLVRCPNCTQRGAWRLLAMGSVAIPGRPPAAPTPIFTPSAISDALHAALRVTVSIRFQVSRARASAASRAVGST